MLKFLAGAFILAGLAVLVADLLPAFSDNTPPSLEALAVWWIWFDNELLGLQTFQLVQPAIQRHTWPELWDYGVLHIVSAPAALVLIGTGVFFWGLLVATRAKRA